MVALNVNRFGGMIPRQGRQVLPNYAAQSAQNCLLLSGEMRSLSLPNVLADFRQSDPNMTRAFGVARSSGQLEWARFDDDTVDFVKGPLINDKFERYYWTSENDIPRWNTADRIEAGDPPYILGVPEPVAAPVVTPPVIAALGTTRAYVYTFVSDTGEEGPPSQADVEQGDEVGVWAITGMDTTLPAPWDTELNNITEKNIYRTITGTLGNVDYHYVATVLLAQADYNDSAPNDEIGLNRTIESEVFYPPPKDLIGIVRHPNGFLIGFTGGSADIGDTEDATPRDIYFSEPYRPHAWNPGNVLTVQHPIKGLGLFGTSVAICTQGFPYIATGIRPTSMVLTKAETSEPCLSNRRGVVAMDYGVFYPSQNGLLLVNQNGFQNATKDLITKEEWLGDYFPQLFIAGRYQSQYVAMYSQTKGIMFAPDEPQAALIELDGYINTPNIQTDDVTGELLSIADGVIYDWNPVRGIPVVAQWECKEFDVPKPVNFGAARIIFDSNVGVVDPGIVAEYQAWNDLRFAAAPLAPLNFAPLGVVQQFDPQDGTWPPLPENKNTLHFGPLFAVNNLGANAEVTFELYANGKLVMIKQVINDRPFKLPGGFKATRWYFRIRTNVPVLSVKIAETGKELAQV